MKTILLLLISASTFGQCPGFYCHDDQLLCNTEYVTLKAIGATHYYWSTNGANKMQDSTASFFTYPYTWSGAVTLTATCGDSSYFRTINIFYVYCTGVKEIEPNNQVQPVYYDLTGNKVDPIQGQLLIERRGNYRRKILIQ